jgi:hypothetical protein
VARREGDSGRAAPHRDGAEQNAKGERGCRQPLVANLTGTAYAKWAAFSLAGQGKYNAQFIVGSMSISGNATVTINARGKNFGKANLVFLVE